MIQATVKGGRPVDQRIGHQSLVLNPGLDAREAETNTQVHIVWIGLEEDV